MMQSRKLFFLLLLLLPFLFTVQDSEMILPQPLAALPPSPVGTPLKVLTWNLHFLPTVNPLNAIPRRARAIAAAIAAEDPAIVVMQEVFLGKARRQIRSLLQLRYPYAVGPCNETPTSLYVNSGVWVLSKIPLDSLGSIQFGDCAGTDCFARKGALMVQGNWQGKDFQLITTHLQAEHRADIRKQQMHQIENELIAPRRSMDAPLFLCGDFNTDIRDGDAYQEMLQVLDASDERPNGPVQHTYEDIPNGKMLLDYVLVRHCNSLNIERRILPKAYMPDDPKAELSDHLPLVATVTL